jgi:hypothetical protein
MDRVFENVQLRMIRVKDLKAEGKKLRKRIFFWISVSGIKTTLRDLYKCGYGGLGPAL